MNETIPAFLKLKEQGKVRAIGVNAFNPSLLLPFIKSGYIDSIQNVLPLYAQPIFAKL